MPYENLVNYLFIINLNVIAVWKWLLVGVQVFSELDVDLSNSVKLLAVS